MLRHLILLAIFVFSCGAAMADPPHGNVTRLHLWLLKIQPPADVAAAAEACEKYYDTIKNAYFPDYADACSAVNAKLIDAEKSSLATAAVNEAAERKLIDSIAGK